MSIFINCQARTCDHPGSYFCGVLILQVVVKVCSTMLPKFPEYPRLPPVLIFHMIKPVQPTRKFTCSQTSMNLLLRLGNSKSRLCICFVVWIGADFVKIQHWSHVLTTLVSRWKDVLVLKNITSYNAVHSRALANGH